MTKKEFKEKKTQYMSHAECRKVVVLHRGTVAANRVFSMYTYKCYDSIYSLYKRPSAEKVRIYTAWKDYCELNENIRGFRLCSGTAQNLTIGFYTVDKNGNVLDLQVLTRDTHYIVVWDTVE